VTDPSPTLCILAGAGAGKTRVLTRRIAYRAVLGQASGEHSLAITFTRKAAGELRSRLAELGLRPTVAAGTFHAIASAQLAQFWADSDRPPLSLLERKAALLGTLCSRRPGLSQAPVAELASVIEWAKARMIGPAHLAEELSRSPRRLPEGVSPEALAALYQRYEDEKSRRHLADFDDLLALCAQALETDSTFAAAQRWRWQHFYVDEFQDLNPLQHRLLCAWLGGRDDLCVVGDPNQAIYGWNGADSAFLEDFPKRWPRATVVRLDLNHRSSAEIVAAAAAVLGSKGSALRSTGRRGPAPKVVDYPDELSEARAIASHLQAARREGLAWSSMAVLARTNAQLVPIRSALDAQGVPCWSPSGTQLLDEPPVRAFLAKARLHQSAPLRIVLADLEESLAYPGNATGQQAAAAGAEHDLLPEAKAPLDEEEQVALGALADLARELLAMEPAAEVGRWLTWLPSHLSERFCGPEPGADRVTLCSFHRAKGLEWEWVWVAGLERGFVPIGSPGPGQHAEERRLLYVAVTRAQTHLSCSWARQRHFGVRAVRRDPSPWLEALCSANAPQADPVPKAAQESLATARRTLRLHESRSGRGPRREPLTHEEQDLVAAIKSWRSSAALRLGLPAYMILHDATVAALAQRRPSSLFELEQVPGLGPSKSRSYGEELLRLVQGTGASRPGG